MLNSCSLATCADRLTNYLAVAVPQKQTSTPVTFITSSTAKLPLFVLPLLVLMHPSSPQLSWL